MRIDNNVDNSALNLTQSVSQAATSAHGNCASSKSRPTSDSADISQLAAQLSADPNRIAQLEAAVASGTYKVSPSQIAASLINEMLA